MKSNRWLGVGAVLAALLVLWCLRSSDIPRIPDLSSWLGGAKSPTKIVKLGEGVYATVLNHEDGSMDRLCLTQRGEVILTIELYGNGRAISIASSDEPTLLVHQSESGLDVSRYLRLPNGSFQQIVYGQDGRVIEQSESAKPDEPAVAAPAAN